MDDDQTPGDATENPGQDAVDGALAAAYGRPADVPSNASILVQLERQGDPAPRVLLRDAQDEESPVVRPGTRESPGGRYQTVGEVARGGVGVILKCRDVDLGRDVAMKVLQSGHKDNDQLIERFIEEAQIGGQLQHPGIVPVYELGLTEEKRPYFTMKFVKGETLAALLSDRDTPSVGRRKLLGIFELVCMTMGYAHSRGVIHRDLKPANIIYGAFHEVMVVDWGFAKVMGRGGVVDERRAKVKAEHPKTVVQTLRSGSGTDSQAGSVMGTPSYMPPEQAIGEVESMDTKSDVFSLGAILCEILTGLPPYPPGEVSPLVQAAQARLEPAFERLDGCGADEPLIALAKRCLDPVPSKRPADGGHVGRTVASHLHSVEERARDLKVDAAQARTRAEGEQKRRRLVLGLAAAVLIAVGGFFWADRERGAKVAVANRAVARVLEDANLLRGKQDWDAALAKVAQASDTGADADDETRAQITRLDAQILAERNEARDRAEAERAARSFVDRLDELRAWWGTGYDLEARDIELKMMLADLDAEAIRTHPSAPTIRLALDTWGKQPHLLSATDPDPLRAEIRALEGDALVAFFQAGRWKEQDAETRVLLAERLGRAKHVDAAIEIHRTALALDDQAFFPKLALGWWLTQGSEPDVGEAIGYLLAAHVQRPGSLASRYQLAKIFSARKDRSSALRHWSHLIATDADYADVKAAFFADLLAEARIQLTKRDLDRALELTETANSVDPDHVEVLAMRANVARRRGDLATLRTAIEALVEREPERHSARSVLMALDTWEGRFEDAENHARTLRDQAVAANNPVLAQSAAVALQAALRVQIPGDPDGAIQRLQADRDEMIAKSPEMQAVLEKLGPAMRASWDVERVNWLLDAGRESEARDLADAALEVLRSEPVFASQTPLLEWRLAFAFGDWEAALTALDQLDADPRMTDQTKAQNQPVRAVVLGRLGRTEDADAAWADAFGQLERGLAAASDDERYWWANQTTAAFRLAPASVREDHADAVFTAIADAKVYGREQAAAFEAGDPGRRGYTDNYMRTWVDVEAKSLAAAGRHTEALAVFQDLDPMRSPLTMTAESVAWFAVSLAATGHADEARAAAERVLLWRKTMPKTQFDFVTPQVEALARQVLEDLDK